MTCKYGSRPFLESGLLSVDRIEVLPHSPNDFKNQLTLFCAACQVKLSTWIWCEEPFKIGQFILVKKNINGFVRTCNYCLADNVKASFHPMQSKSEMVCLFSCLPLAWFALKPCLPRYTSGQIDLRSMKHDDSSVQD